MENSEGVVSRIDYYTPQVAVSIVIGPRDTVACVVGGGKERRRGDIWMCRQVQRFVVRNVGRRVHGMQSTPTAALAFSSTAKKKFYTLASAS